jgi:hypothetical protein
VYLWLPSHSTDSLSLNLLTGDDDGLGGDDFVIPPGFGDVCISPASFLIDIFETMLEFVPLVCPESTPVCDKHGSGGFPNVDDFIGGFFDDDIFGGGGDDDIFGGGGFSFDDLITGGDDAAVPPVTGTWVSILQYPVHPQFSACSFFMLDTHLLLLFVFFRSAAPFSTPSRPCLFPFPSVSIRNLKHSLQINAVSVMQLLLVLLQLHLFKQAPELVTYSYKLNS